MEQPLIPTPTVEIPWDRVTNATDLVGVVSCAIADQVFADHPTLDRSRVLDWSVGKALETIRTHLPDWWQLYLDENAEAIRIIDADATAVAAAVEVLV